MQPLMSRRKSYRQLRGGSGHSRVLSMRGISFSPKFYNYTLIRAFLSILLVN